MKKIFIKLLQTTAIIALVPAFSATAQKSQLKKINQDKIQRVQQSLGSQDALSQASPVRRIPVKGYVLTHEHPMVAMSFGGNYAFTGATGNFANGIMENGYTAQCSGCDPLLENCDHGEFAGSMFELLGLVAPDMRGHNRTFGPQQKSFSHVKYSTEWVREAFNPPEQRYKDARMRIMVAYAVENEVMCDSLYGANQGNGGTGGNGYACQRGDSFQSLRRQILATKAWARANSSWMQVALSASEAREIVESGKLAIIIGVEADYAFGAENKNFDVVRRLNQYHDLGVRTFYPAHKLNSRLTGADIYRSAKESSGQLLRMNQAFAGCFYYDDNVGPFPLHKDPDDLSSHNYCDNNLKRNGKIKCGPNHFQGQGLNSGCVAKVDEFSNATIAAFAKKPARKKLNGFAAYPLPPEFSGTAGSSKEAMPREWYSGNDTHTIEYNNLGMSRQGRRVMAAAMKKGMIITTDHMSKLARAELKVMSDERRKYPLNAFHNNPNAMLIGGKKVGPYGNKTRMQYPNEYDLNEEDLLAIKQSHGIFGARLGPIDARDNMTPRAGVTEDCPGSATENAKVLAYLIDKDINVGYSLDFTTITQGTFSASRAGCSIQPTNDTFDKYQDKRRSNVVHNTQGLSHMGMMKKFHEELRRVNLNDRYVNALKDDGVEQFLQMWERSEARAGRHGYPSNPGATELIRVTDPERRQQLQKIKNPKKTPRK